MDSLIPHQHIEDRRNTPDRVAVTVWRPPSRREIYGFEGLVIFDSEVIRLSSPDPASTKEAVLTPVGAKLDLRITGSCLIHPIYIKM